MAHVAVRKFFASSIVLPGNFSKIIDPEAINIKPCTRISCFSRSSASPFTTHATPVAIATLNKAFNEDKNPQKLNLGEGTVRDENGNPYMFPSVKKAKQNVLIREKQSCEFEPLQHQPEFCNVAAKLAMANAGSNIFSDTNHATISTPSGTSALQLLAVHLANNYNGSKIVYMPNKTWFVHESIFKETGIETKGYRYFDSDSYKFDFNSVCEDMIQMPKKSMILFHACAHNPTGVDPTPEQWKEISHIAKQRKILAIFDMAYQGLASGDIDEDVFSIRQFLNDSNRICLAQTFSKNMSLYTEHVGALTIICEDKEHAKEVFNNLTILQELLEPAFSHSPMHGVKIVTETLKNNDIFEEWKRDVKSMATYINRVRKDLRNAISHEGSVQNWDHIIKQIGMFCYSGLTSEQVLKLAQEHSIYCMKDGRMTLASLKTADDIGNLGRAIHAVTR